MFSNMPHVALPSVIMPVLQYLGRYIEGKQLQVPPGVGAVLYDMATKREVAILDSVVRHRQDLLDVGVPQSDIDSVLKALGQDSPQLRRVG